MHVLDKKDEIRKWVFLMREGVALCMNNIPKC
jgi:hypothetical protein